MKNILELISGRPKRRGRMELKGLLWVGLAVAVAFGLGKWSGLRAASDHGEHAAGAQAEVVQYQCPMHPTYISDKPGECPICGMTLVKVEQQEHSGHAGHEAMVEGYASVKIAPQRQQLIGVKTDVVKRRKLTRTINTVGWIAYDPDLYHAQEEYIAAVAGLKKMDQSTIPEIRERAAKLVESSKLRLRLQGLSDEQIEAMADQTEPDRRLLLGDVKGSVWLYGTVYEYELPLVEEGSLVDIEVKAFPGEGFQGHVEAIDTVLDPTTRSARVRVVIPNPEGKLKPQMFANARIHVALGEHLAVPAEAVMDTGTRQIVFVDEGEGHFSPREVRLGHKAEDSYIVVSGLSEGERVVTSGNFLIDSESKLRAATSTAAAGGHQH